MILVTGATGQIGRLVVEHLVDMKVSVRAFVRNENAFKDVNYPSLEIATGTFENEASLERAMQGVKILFLVARDNPEQVAQHENVIKAAEKSGVKHIVKLSAFGADKGSPIALMRWHAETEERLRNSELDWTFLRPQLYMQNLLRFRTSVSENGSFSAPMGSEAYALIDIRDIAEAAAAVLNNADKHVSKIYTLTGPAAVTYEEIAEHLSAILKKTINYRSISQKLFNATLLEEGTPSWRAYDLAYIADAYTDTKNELVTNDVDKLLGRSARSIQVFLADHFTTTR
jgi:uncharacterized protein YbjT (DUF2867 family)